MTFKKISIIYNPHSTGDSPKMAQELYRQLQKKLPQIPIQLAETKHAGHAEVLAYKAAADKDVLIVSVSGDGGYNEVINGALRAAGKKKTSPVCMVMPGGNANDHYTSMHRQSPLNAILGGNVIELDIMQVKFGKTTRYAHSYVGLGLTPLVAEELNKHSLTAYKEAWLAIKTYWRLRPFEIEYNGARYNYDSILMTTIGRMAKHLTLSRSISAQDGNFALLKWPHKNKWRLTSIIFKAMLNKPLPKERVKDFRFTVIKPQPMQLDGELIKLPRGTSVSVVIQPGKLRTIL